MLHDVGKVKELSEFPKNDYTDEGNFLGHIVIGYEMVMEKVKQIDGFPDMLAMQIGHCILHITESLSTAHLRSHQ